ncbi:MAG: class I fructose-bisphosphate aldolase family protein [Deltaproteobacteria bacterium]|nr:class I fructose-bisphosphate aldolase family protein [Deltaproteobacteria bacterium]
MIGKEIRMARIMDQKRQKTVIVPMDHGVSVGPVAGLLDMKHAISEASKGGANAVVIHKGFVASGRGKQNTLGLIVHLSGSTALSPEPHAKTLVCTVEEAIKLGADAVSVHVNLGNNREKEMLSDLSSVARVSNEWGIPLLAMIYCRGNRIKNEFDPEAIKHGARLGAELGADLVKVPYTGDPESFSRVVEGCGVPVVIAGGAKMNSDRDVLEMVSGAVSAGAAGLSIGRNVFQHHSPSVMIQAMSLIVHKRRTVDEALSVLARCTQKAA